MKIIFASTDYPEPGQSAKGLPIYLQRISTALVERGHSVIVVYGAMYNQHRYDGGVEIYAVRTPMGIKLGDPISTTRIRSLLRGYYINKKVKELIKERIVDIIQFVSLEGIAILYDGQVPAVIRLSSYAKMAFSSKYNTLSQELVECYSKLEIDAGKHIGNVFGPSEPTALMYGQDVGFKVQVIESPFWPLDYFDESTYKKELATRKYALFFGKMYAEKGIIEICDVLKDFLQRNRDYYFAFVGEDSEIDGKSAYTLIRESAGKYLDRVVILPEIKHSQLFPIVSHAEFVVLPSYMENFSNACMEAMYYNGCVIAYSNAGFEQLLINDESGFLCDNGNSVALLNTINKVVDMDERQLSEIRKRARLRIEDNKPGTIVGKLVDYYDKVIAKSNHAKYHIEPNYYNQIAPYADAKSQLKLAISEADKRYLNSRILAEWIRLLMCGRDPIEEYFSSMAYSKVAVYGMMDLGKILVDGLENKGINVSYLIDRNVGAGYKKYKVYQPGDSLPEVDLIIVTPVAFFDEISDQLRERNLVKIVSVEDVIFLDKR